MPKISTLDGGDLGQFLTLSQNDFFQFCFPRAPLSLKCQLARDEHIHKSFLTFSPFPEIISNKNLGVPSHPGRG